METIETKFSIGDIVKHKFLEFRGVIFDLDPEFNNTDEWYDSIPASFRPSKEQPFYHLLAENGDIFYTAYVSQQNLEHDLSTDSLRHPEIPNFFSGFKNGKFLPNARRFN